MSNPERIQLLLFDKGKATVDTVSISLGVTSTEARYTMVYMKCVESRREKRHLIYEVTFSPQTPQDCKMCHFSKSGSSGCEKFRRLHHKKSLEKRDY